MMDRKEGASNAIVMTVATVIVLLLTATVWGMYRLIRSYRLNHAQLSPLLRPGKAVDWWFVFKFDAAAFPGCNGTQSCPFGGTVQGYAKGLQYAYASSDHDTLQMGDGCLGSRKEDPLATTFDQVYNGTANYVVWNDQLSGSPVPTRAGPWGTSKGILAWNQSGEGFVAQVSTPSWPASGSARFPRAGDGNSLGCIKDDNVLVSQHFFALKLNKDDTVKVLTALKSASAVTDPKSPQLVHNGGPADIQILVDGLGTLSSDTAPVITTLSSGVQLITKPSALHVPPWQMVSSMLGAEHLTVASWWMSPTIPSTSNDDKPACWDPALGYPGPVTIATLGHWQNKVFNLKGGLGDDSNHAKVGVSTEAGTNVTIFGDLNQDGTLGEDLSCASSQNGRGGLFFVLDDAGLALSVGSLLGTQLPTPTRADRLRTWIVLRWRVATVWVGSHAAMSVFGLAVLTIGVELYYFSSRQNQTQKPITSIEEIFSSDSPVASVKDDRLDQSGLVSRLSRFLQKPNTSPPLVISLDASWGMGKSSVMRMLETQLREDTAAATVWFNAWHHQTEDQLLAYLMETIQKQAIPPWFSAIGLWFRIDLIRVRLFASVDRLVLTLISLVLFAVYLWRRDDFARLSAAHPALNWLGSATLVTLVAAVLHILVAFKSNPEKLAERSSGFVVTTLKEMIRLPSLVGKSDVRQEFANNLKDVVEALYPRRLVIFLDDLDRCKSDQVMQILEAINFLSSAAPCVVIVGADYKKVETLVAMGFEAVARNEAQNAGKYDETDIVPLRVRYARDYLKKIVNLRLNLRLPRAEHFAKLLAENPAEIRAARRGLQRTKVFSAMILPMLLGTGLALWLPPLPPLPKTPSKTVVPVTASALQSAPAEVKESTQPTPQSVERPPQAAPRRSRLPWKNMLVGAGIPGLICLLVVTYQLSRPKKAESAQDAASFAKALAGRNEEIFKRCDTPREVRRFLNYLRLIATEPVPSPNTPGLRNEFKDRFDRDLVFLATGGYDKERGAAAEKLLEHYETQCRLFGLDPSSFLPMENMPQSAK